jgi:hypothetical protein
MLTAEYPLDDPERLASLGYEISSGGAYAVLAQLTARASGNGLCCQQREGGHPRATLGGQFEECRSMSIVSSRRRTTWRVGSALAAVAGSAVLAAAVVSRRRAGWRPRHAVTTAGTALHHAPGTLNGEDGGQGGVVTPPPVPDDVDVPDGANAAAPSEAEIEAQPPQKDDDSLAEVEASSAGARAPSVERMVPGQPAALAAAHPNSEQAAELSPPYPPVVESAGQASPPGRTGRGRWRLVALGIVVVVIGLGATIAGMGTGTDDQPDAAGAATDREPTTAQPSTTAVDRLTPDEAFAQASRRLEMAGSFGYSGTSQATDVSAVRPGLWLAVELTVAGEVDLSSGRMHEVAVVPTGGASETLTDGMTVWGRLASSGEDLAAEPYQTVGEQDDDTPRRLGVALLPSWLETSVEGEELLADGTGRRTFRATIPADVLGEVEEGKPAVAAEVLLSIDAAGDPVHVEVTTAPDGPPLRLVLDLARLGEPMAIAMPGEDPVGDV